LVLLAVAVIGGLIGGAVGGGSSSDQLTIVSNSSSPGAARLPNGASIPSLVNRVIHSVVSIDVKNQGQEDQGTGMIITADGLVVTNNHVIALANPGGTITVTSSGSTKEQPAVLVGTDPSNDVALLRIEGASGLTPVTFGNSDKLEVGDAAVAIGNALGLAAGTPTVTSGIISALGRTVTAGDSSSSSTETLTNMIQTDAAINPGNSGGPLLDANGSVIGMNTAVAGSSLGSSAQNIGFAITSAKIRSLLPQLKKGGNSTAAGGGFMGVQIASVTPDLRSQYNLTPMSGAVILDVVSGSPAEKAGLRQGDVLVNVDGKQITSAEQVTAVTRSLKPGDVIEVTYVRGTERSTTKVTLGTPPK
jgi:putative serine protease PepD